MISDTMIASLKQLLGEQVVSVTEDAVLGHSYDAWPVAVKWKLEGKQPLKPDVVVYASTLEQISRLLRWASERRVAITPWGAGSSVTGASLPLDGGICLDLSRMNRLIEIDDTNLLVRVQSGMMGHVLEDTLNRRGYTLNHSPQSLDRSTVGGWIATRATGQFSSRYGGIEDLVVALVVVLPGGEIIETKSAPRASVGPDLRQLFLGSEGTMGVVGEVTLRVFPLAPYRRLEALRFAAVESGVTAMRQIMQSGLRPFLVRFYDEVEARYAVRDQNFDGCVMFLGFEGIQAVAEAEYQAAVDFCTAHGAVLIGSASVEGWMSRRYDFSTVENLLNSRGGVAETIEIAHVWDQIVPTYRAMKAALAPLATEVLGHFSHVYTHGTSLYLILLGQVENDAEAESRLLRIWDVAMSTALEHGAVISHHHGVGIARLPFVRRTLGENVDLLEVIKNAVDPAGIMSPGKLGLSK
jgi:alkyldihydroxyacetonephosphate synthase